MINRSLRAALEQDGTAYGLWVSLDSAAVTEIAAEMGLDWVAIDLEHGHMDGRDVVNHLRAARGSNLSVLVRVASGSEESIKTALDLGADGVMIPLVRSVADVEQAVSLSRYPPLGRRTVGGDRATLWGLKLAEYLSTANDDVLVIPIFETLEAVEAMEDILAVPGVDVVFFGPGDLSACQGYLGSWEGPEVADQILSVVEAARLRGIATGVITSGVEDVRKRHAQGFRMLALGTDAGALIGHIARSRGLLESRDPGDNRSVTAEPVHRPA